MLDVRMFPVLADNYAFLVRDCASGQVAAIDTPDADAILAQAARLGWPIHAVWNTHWHPDHAGGNAAIKAATGCTITGPAEVARLAPLDQVVAGGDTVRLGATIAQVIDVGGHTLGHVAYHAAAARTAFVGDALFALGCGRLFEGAPQQMWDSLQRLAALPDDTTLYCAHEYTLANGRFAMTVEADNPALQARWDEIRRLRAAGLATVPMTLAQEKATNPFLRADAPGVRAAVGLPDAPAWAVFAEVRARKDAFR